MQLKTVVTEPTSPDGHTHTVIFLHGRGDSAPNFQSSIAHWRDDSHSQWLADVFPSFKFIFPQSELRRLSSSQHPEAKLNQWFDIWDINQLDVKAELQIDGLGESVKSILEIARTEVEQNLDGDWGRLVLAGFSQGGAVVAHTVINTDDSVMDVNGDENKKKRLGGVMIFSATMPFPGRSLEETRKVLGILEGGGGGGGGDGLQDEIVRNTPVLVQHCTDDETSRVENGRELRDSLEGFGAKVTWKEYPFGDQWLHSPEGFEDTVAWLRKYVLQEGELQ